MMRPERGSGDRGASWRRRRNPTSTSASADGPTSPGAGPFIPTGLPQKRELEYASRQLTSIEINGTYYGSQKPESFANWREETPDDFVFSVKGSALRHKPARARRGRRLDRALSRERRLELKEKLGPINWQFLPTKRFDAADFEAFLKLLPKSVDGRDAPARRGGPPRELPRAGIRGAAARLRVHRASRTRRSFPQIPDVTAPFAYARLQGASEKIKTGYAPKDLDVWAARAREWSEGTTAAASPSSASPRESHRRPRCVRLHDQRIQAESTSRRHGVDRAGVGGQGVRVSARDQNRTSSIMWSDSCTGVPSTDIFPEPRPPCG